ncbi:hypothetical protein CsSME_00000552 [Camellia sinensis var. sinensis]
MNYVELLSERTILSETGRSPKWLLPRLLKIKKYPVNNRYSSTGLCLATRNGGIRQQLHGIGDKDSVVIVDHGSRIKESNLMLDEFAAMFRDKTGYPIVEPAHIELAEPSIRDAFGLCVQQGANRVIVSPFLLFPGRHWHQDIPSLTAEAAKGHPGVSYIVTAPLGFHELLVCKIS